MYLPGIHVMWGSCRAPYSHLSSIEKSGCCREVLTMQSGKKASAQSSGQCVQPSTDQLWDLKKGQQFTLLKRITNYKSVNSESVGGSVLSQRVPSRGSCHLVDSTWVTHLNWNNFANSDGMHRSWQRHQTKKPNPSRMQWKKRGSIRCSILMRRHECSVLTNCEVQINMCPDCDNRVEYM